MNHAPTLPSYYIIDWEDDGSENRHPGLLISHAVLMSLAFFVVLPVGTSVLFSFQCHELSFGLLGIAMRSVKQAGHGAATVAFYALCALGCSASALYTKLTPNM